MILQLKVTVKSQTAIHLMKNDTTVLSLWHGCSFRVIYKDDDFRAKSLPGAKTALSNDRTKYNDLRLQLESLAEDRDVAMLV
jgi:hypothetical protein